MKPPSLFEFIKAIVGGWFARLSGALGVVCGIFGLFAPTSTAKLVFYIASALGFLGATYSAWKKERSACCSFDERQRPKPQPLLRLVLVEGGHGFIAAEPGFYLRNLGSPALDVTLDDIVIGPFVAHFATIPDLVSATEGGIEEAVSFQVGLADETQTSYGENIHTLFLHMPPSVIYSVDVIVRYWDLGRHRRFASAFSVKIDCMSQVAEPIFVSQTVEIER